MDRGAWWATVHRVTKSWTQLNFHIHVVYGCFNLQQQSSVVLSDCLVLLSGSLQKEFTDPGII